MAKAQPRVRLYHAPPSFYSQVARLVLAEKGVPHEQQVVLPGPPSFETYAPWYMRLNAGGTVPTLVIDDEPIDDSRKILHAVDARFDGPALVPSDEPSRAEMERWLDRAYELPERILAYGSSKFKALGTKVNHRRRRALLAHRTHSPELREAYETKLSDIEAFLTETHDPALVEATEQRYDQALDALDHHLAERRYICGQTYTLADVVWTVTVARQLMLGRTPFSQRPALSTWYGRMKSRPSFARAKIWESFHLLQVLPVIVGKYRGPLLVVAIVLTTLVAALVLVFGR